MIEVNYDAEYAEASQSLLGVDFHDYVSCEKLSHESTAQACWPEFRVWMLFFSRFCVTNTHNAWRFSSATKAHMSTKISAWFLDVFNIHSGQAINVKQPYFEWHFSDLYLISLEALSAQLKKHMLTTSQCWQSKHKCLHPLKYSTNRLIDQLIVIIFPPQGVVGQAWESCHQALSGCIQTEFQSEGISKPFLIGWNGEVCLCSEGVCNAIRQRWQNSALANRVHASTHSCWITLLREPGVSAVSLKIMTTKEENVG